MENIANKPISELSFMILTKSSSENERNLAYQEIKRRFAKTGCGYDTFMEYEGNVIDKRGSDINAYLIQESPTGQLLLELYFKYIYGQEMEEHKNLLFSEVLLCNANSQPSFFTRALKIELKNLKQRIKQNQVSEEELERLTLVFKILEERYFKEPNIWYEDSVTNCILDIVDTLASYMSVEKAQQFEEIVKSYRGRISAKYLQGLFWGILVNIDLFDHLYMQHIANKELAKLKGQQTAIRESLKSSPITDYSFVDVKKLMFENPELDLKIK